ncbi:MAG: hypothetical protein MI976_11240 [Pseudomonadales bacterium]|nr:hypothetical protein [Pseudomonadales bacterium]
MCDSLDDANSQLKSCGLTPEWFQVKGLKVSSAEEKNITEGRAKKAWDKGEIKALSVINCRIRCIFSNGQTGYITKGGIIKDYDTDEKAWRKVSELKGVQE